ncbi:hypothetical protein [Sanguibacter massiliensis]|uniref:hypothetical protein n=1 Tax=Sanguibacter massiliensis TaxID=1973217 RepID=UPI000C83A5F0|nr:hypothetical protein [Sanguibacter massiliensis]
MSGWGALAVTGVVLLVAAIALGVSAEVSRGWEARERSARIGWTVFALACACFIGAVWWAAA